MPAATSVSGEAREAKAANRNLNRPSSECDSFAPAAPRRVILSVSHKVLCVEVVLQKSIPAQIRQLILYICNREGNVDGFVGVFANRLEKHFQ